MSDHKPLSPAVMSHGILSAGQSATAENSRELGIADPFKRIPDLRCLAERAVLYVDCSLARSGYAGKLWFAQIEKECEQRHKDLLSINAARKAFGVEAIPYGLTLTHFSSSGPLAATGQLFPVAAFFVFSGNCFKQFGAERAVSAHVS
jgi:hypothetical protein